MTAVQTVGRLFLAFLEAVGEVTDFTLVSVSHCLRRPFYFRLIGRQMLEIGYYSLPVIALTTLFAGMPSRGFFRRTFQKVGDHTKIVFSIGFVYAYQGAGIVFDLTQQGIDNLHIGRMTRYKYDFVESVMNQ